MYSGRLRSSSRRRSNSPDSAPNKSRYKKTRDASMHSRSSSRESCPDMDVDKNQHMIRQIFIISSKKENQRIQKKSRRKILKIFLNLKAF